MDCRTINEKLEPYIPFLVVFNKTILVVYYVMAELGEALFSAKTLE